LTSLNSRLQSNKEEVAEALGRHAKQGRGSGFRASGLRFHISVFGLRVSGLWFLISGFWSLVSGFRFRILSVWFQASSLGFRVESFRCERLGRSPWPACPSASLGFRVWGSWSRVQVPGRCEKYEYEDRICTLSEG